MASSPVYIDALTQDRFLRHFLTPLQAINLYGERPYLQPELQEARDFVQATEHSKQLTNAFRADIQKYWDELESARRKLQVLTHLSSADLCRCIAVPMTSQHHPSCCHPRSCCRLGWNSSHQGWQAKPQSLERRPLPHAYNP